MRDHDPPDPLPGWESDIGALAANVWQPTVRSYETAVRSTLFSLGDSGIFRVEIDDSAVQHQISRSALGGMILLELEQARQHAGAVSPTDAFARGENGHLWHWSGSWEDTQISFVGVPAVVLNSAHSLDVFFRDPNNGLGQAWKTGSSWTSASLGGLIASDPAAVSWGSGRFDVVAFGTNDLLFHWSSAQSSFDGPFSTVAGVGTPTVVSAGSNSLDVVFRNMTAAVTRVSWNGSTWATEPLGGAILGLPSAGVTPGPVRRVYALGTDHMLFEQGNHKRLVRLAVGDVGGRGDRDAPQRIASRRRSSQRFCRHRLCPEHHQ